MSNEKLKEKCELIIKIIDGLNEAEKGELNDIYQEFDTAKEDLKNILGFEDSENLKQICSLMHRDDLAEDEKINKIFGIMEGL